MTLFEEKVFANIIELKIDLGPVSASEPALGSEEPVYIAGERNPLGGSGLVTHRQHQSAWNRGFAGSLKPQRGVGLGSLST